MDLLGQDTQKKQKTNGQKIVLMLLITSIILAFFVGIMIVALRGNKTKSLKLLINGQDTQISQDMLISNENGVNYISLQQLSKLIGYNYVKGGYREYVEDSAKCYLESTNQIIGFEANSNKIYKTSQTSQMDYEYYYLKNKIMQLNDTLYIALDDLNVGCNVQYKFSNEQYAIVIDTVENLVKGYVSIFEPKGLTIDDNVQNKEAIVYDMVVVANESGKLGVVDSNANTIISHKYSTIEFDEYTQNFIVSNENGRYGVISITANDKGEKNTNIVIDIWYDSIRIINYSPVLYEVKANNKVGVLDEKGERVVDIAYDKLGFSEEVNGIEPALVIKKLSENQDAIVVCNGARYGLVDLATGETIINCELEKIYSRTDESKNKTYYVQLQGTEVTLSKYIEHINTTTVVTN